jgi:hypothetical protein
MVAVADRAGAQRRQVGAGLRLRVADREVRLTGRDPGQQVGPLLGGAVPGDGRPDRVDGQERHRHPGHGRLVGEDELVDPGPAAATVLDRPAQRQPAVPAQPAHHRAIGLAVAVFAVVVGERGAQLRRHQAGEVRPQLLAKLLLLRCVSHVHVGHPMP